MSTSHIAQLFLTRPKIKWVATSTQMNRSRRIDVQFAIGSTKYANKLHDAASKIIIENSPEGLLHFTAAPTHTRQPILTLSRATSCRIIVKKTENFLAASSLHLVQDHYISEEETTRSYSYGRLRKTTRSYSFSSTKKFLAASSPPWSVMFISPFGALQPHPLSVMFISPLCRVAR